MDFEYKFDGEDLLLVDHDLECYENCNLSGEELTTIHLWSVSLVYNSNTGWFAL